MRRKDKQITNIAEIEEILSKADVCRIAMCDGTIPYLVPVNFGYRDRTLYIHSARVGRKIDILKKNDHVCFEVETDVEILGDTVACGWGTRYRSVIGSGRASLIEDSAGKKKALDVIMSKCSGAGDHSYDEKKVDAITVIRIDIAEMSGKKSGMA